MPADELEVRSPCLCSAGYSPPALSPANCCHSVMADSYGSMDIDMDMAMATAMDMDMGIYVDVVVDICRETSSDCSCQRSGKFSQP